MTPPPRLLDAGFWKRFSPRCPHFAAELAKKIFIQPELLAMAFTLECPLPAPRHLWPSPLRTALLWLAFVKLMAPQTLVAQARFTSGNNLSVNRRCALFSAGRRAHPDRAGVALICCSGPFVIRRARSSLCYCRFYFAPCRTRPNVKVTHFLRGWRQCLFYRSLEAGAAQRIRCFVLCAPLLLSP